MSIAVFVAQYYASAWTILSCVVHLSRLCVFWKQIHISSKIFSPSSSHTIPVFPLPHIISVCWRGPPSPTEASNAGEVIKNCDFRPIAWITACRQHSLSVSCYQQVPLCHTSVNVVYDKVEFPNLPLTVWMALTTVLRTNVLHCEHLDITPKTTEQNVIVCHGKSEIEITDNKKLYFTHCTVTANYYRPAN